MVVFRAQFYSSWAHTGPRIQVLSSSDLSFLFENIFHPCQVWRHLEGASNFNVCKLSIMNILQGLELDHFMTTVVKEPTINVGRTEFRRTIYLLTVMIKMTVATNSSNQYIHCALQTLCTIYIDMLQMWTKPLQIYFISKHMMHEGFIWCWPGRKREPWKGRWISWWQTYSVEFGQATNNKAEVTTLCSLEIGIYLKVSKLNFN